jgi:hypothetical protein
MGYVDKAKAAAGRVWQYSKRGRKHYGAMARGFVTGGPVAVAKVAVPAGYLQAVDMYNQHNRSTEQRPTPFSVPT